MKNIRITPEQKAESLLRMSLCKNGCGKTKANGNSRCKECSQKFLLAQQK